MCWIVGIICIYYKMLQPHLKPMCFEVCIRIVWKVCWIHKLANSWAGLSEKLERKVSHITTSAILQPYTICQGILEFYALVHTNNINQNLLPNYWTSGKTPKPFISIWSNHLLLAYGILYSIRLCNILVDVVFSKSAYDMISWWWGRSWLELA